MSGGRRIIDDQVVHGGYWRVRRVVLEDDGEPDSRLVREIVEAKTASAVLLFDRTRDVVMLVRQFRPAIFVGHGVDLLLEVSAGVAEPGETAVACAIRETMEETGVAISSPRRVGYMYPSPGVCTERIDLFIADYSHSARIGRGGGLAHEQEFTEPVEMSFDNALAAMRDGAIVDAKTIILLQALALEKAQIAHRST
jgi:nudix-type nucleoside diphosphatase (YffH/AdpP family)